MPSSSGTYSFQLSNASIAQQAFARLQIRRPALLAEHMVDAYTETNLMLSSISNLSPNLWTIELVSVPLIQGTATYSVDPSIIMILDAYISLVGSTTSDRLIFPISRTEYSSYPNKQAQSAPTVFWFDRLINPTITLWEVPDQTNFYTLNYYACRQVQDANLPAGEVPNIPYRWVDYMVAGLAHRLARIYKPELEAARKVDADEAWKIAATQDIENTDLVIAPQMDNFFR
jgi:hypothetical protein